MKHLPYRLLLLLLFPLVVLYTLRRSFRDGDRRYFWQRFGCQQPKMNQPIWLHCASVGEVNAALPLLKALLTEHPNATFLLTTNTPSGQQIAEKKLDPRVTLSYLPLDYPLFMRRFLHRSQPRCALIMETEIWPNLYHRCQQQKIPLTIINARLSQRTLNSHRIFRWAYQQALKNIRILAKSSQDAAHFQTLGADIEQIQIIGNLKFAPQTAPLNTKNPLHRPYLIAISTHDDEELRLAKLWQQIKHHHPQHLLVIAPRHPERRQQILHTLAPLKLQIASRSQSEAVQQHTDLYLADTLGELNLFMQHAELVFIGGSLIAHGGQNLLEPARLGKPIICGAHMFNFQAEVDLFLNHNALLQINNENELSETVQMLLKQPKKRAHLAHNAQALMQQESTV
ncbi:MAG: 3-deoxy-D-manno-octulosonic acid transferase, partial [Gammaproteobacteria bacterium]|nr:3-deoxy-D-manno-octulosonic acid transferase [Gammaproteobacteria bacterium]